MHSALHALPVLQDNVIWIWVCGEDAVVVDPAIAAPVKEWLQARRLRLKAVLQTHHHADHIGGTPELLDHWPDAEVVAAAADQRRIPFQTVSVSDGDQLSLLGQDVLVMDVAAHTSHHIAFFIPQPPGAESEPMLFCGDTLFAGGCGRLFEGTPSDMLQALSRLAALPDATKVCCAHEYTENNLRWAAEQCPQNVDIQKRYQAVKSLRSRGELSLPSTIGLEQQTNLFMQAATAEELGNLRHHKDHWRAA